MAFLKIGTTDFRKTYKYKADKKPFVKSLRTASNRLVQEVSGYKWLLQIEYDYFSEAERSALISAINGGEMTVEFYSSETGQQLTGTFICTKRPMPQIASFNGQVPSMWSGVSFVLEEV